LDFVLDDDADDAFFGRPTFFLGSSCSLGFFTGCDRSGDSLFRFLGGDGVSRGSGDDDGDESRDESGLDAAELGLRGELDADGNLLSMGRGAWTRRVWTATLSGSTETGLPEKKDWSGWAPTTRGMATTICCSSQTTSEAGMEGGVRRWAQ
jgi:hypothetical protein